MTCLPSLAAPVTDAQTAAVMAVLDAMDVRKTMAASFDEMERNMPAMMRSQIRSNPSMSADQKAEALAKFEKALPVLSQRLHQVLADPALLDEITKEMVPSYASAFTVGELKELAVFYRTPLGRKLIVTTPKLVFEGLAAGQKIMTPRLNKLLQETMQGVQKQ